MIAGLSLLPRYFDNLLATVGEVEHKVGGAMLERRKRASTHAHARIPTSSGFVAGLDFGQIPTLAAAQLVAVHLKEVIKLETLFT